MEPLKSGDAESSSLGRNNAPKTSHIFDPLLKACLNGQIHAFMNYGFHLIYAYESYLDTNRNKFCGSGLQILKRDFLILATHRTATLGVFEILRNKLRNGNDGQPLSLYQEACCGFTSGAVGAFAIRPLTLSLHRVGLQCLTYPNLFTSLSHIVKTEGALTLWRGSGWSMAEQAAIQMGLLPSYFRSRNYLESKGLAEWKAETGASILSGFFATAFSHPLYYAKAINDAAKKHRDAGNKNVLREIFGCVRLILTPYSGAQFYTIFLKRFHSNAWFCMMHWSIYESIRGASSSSSSSSKDLMG